MAKSKGKQQKLPYLLNKAMEKQSTNFICITYQGKQSSSALDLSRGAYNGTILLTYEAGTKQLTMPPPYIMDQITTVITLGATRAKQAIHSGADHAELTSGTALGSLYAFDLLIIPYSSL